MTGTLIAPGLDGSPVPHGQHWWAATASKALAADLSGPARPLQGLWEIELASMILLHPGSILGGPSLGPVPIARRLST